MSENIPLKTVFSTNDYWSVVINLRKLTGYERFQDENADEIYDLHLRTMYRKRIWRSNRLQRLDTCRR